MAAQSFAVSFSRLRTMVLLPIMPKNSLASLLYLPEMSENERILLIVSIAPCGRVCVDYEEDLLSDDIHSFNDWLLSYLGRYNGEHPHWGLSLPDSVADTGSENTRFVQYGVAANTP